MAGQRAEVVEQPGRLGAGVGEVAGQWPGRPATGAESVRGGHAHAGKASFRSVAYRSGVSSRACSIPVRAHVVLGGAGEGGEGHPVDPGGQQALAAAAPSR